MVENAKFQRAIRATSTFAAVFRQRTGHDIWSDAGRSLELAYAVRPRRDTIRAPAHLLPIQAKPGRGR